MVFDALILASVASRMSFGKAATAEDGYSVGILGDNHHQATHCVVAM